MKKRLSLLLVEDDIVDAMTVERACNELDVPCNLVHKHNGEDALEYLQSKESNNPSIILLDLNMPRMNGIEFLEAAKKDSRLKKIPVVVLTTSNDEQDRIASYRYGAAGYFVKPPDYKSFLNIAEEISKYWSMSKLPA